MHVKPDMTCLNISCNFVVKELLNIWNPSIDLLQSWNLTAAIHATGNSSSPPLIWNFLHSKLLQPAVQAFLPD